MRMSRLFGRTLRQIPAEAEIPSHQLLRRAGMIRPLAAGLYSCLPLAKRALHKIERIVRAEMDAIGGQEIEMPLVHPAELWQESGRWHDLTGKELVGFKNRDKREFVLAMTNEEAMTDLARQEINSYRQLPLMLYQIKLKCRDEPRPRAGLIRVREFTMKDGYSLHPDQADLDAYYARVYQAYRNIFHRCGIEVVVVESDTGMMGGTSAHEFMLVTDSGENTLILCGGCDYAANADVAVSQKREFDYGKPAELAEVQTPNISTIADLATFLNIDKSQTLKAVFYSTGEEVILVAIRGDMDVNETKVKNILKIPDMWIATADELQQYDIVAGYASPIGLKNVTIAIDDSVPKTSNLVAGANKPGYHISNVNYGRDFKADVVADIALVKEGDVCPHCGGKLKQVRGIEAGNIFKLGTKYSEAMGATYLDKDGKEQPLFMGCYGIGIGRLLACIVEANHDGDGIIFPPSVAPYHIHLLHVGKDQEVIETAEKLSSQLQADGYEVLYDDRNESPGVKFKDADLLGMPIRLTISSRALKEDSVEVKLRREKKKELVKLGEFNVETFIERLK